LLGVLLVPLENLESRLQQVLQLAVARGRDQCLLQGIVHRLVVGDLVIDICLVEGGAAQLGEFGILVGSLLG
jgi:hypothetical protein